MIKAIFVGGREGHLVDQINLSRTLENIDLINTLIGYKFRIDIKTTSKPELDKPIRIV